MFERSLYYIEMFIADIYYVSHGALSQFFLDKNDQRYCFSQVVGFVSLKRGPFYSLFVMKKHVPVVKRCVRGHLPTH